MLDLQLYRQVTKILQYLVKYKIEVIDVGVRGQPPLRGIKDTDNNVSHKARFISIQLGSGYPPNAAGFNEDPRMQSSGCFYIFLNISHGHTEIFMAPGVTYFWYHPHPGGGARLLEDYLSETW
jgi:hypothetical protein